MRTVSSFAGLLGDTVAQTVERTGIPPTAIIPGFQIVARSAGRKPFKAIAEVGDAVSLPAAATREGALSAALMTAIATAKKRASDGRGVAVTFIWLNPLRAKSRVTCSCCRRTLV